MIEIRPNDRLRCLGCGQLLIFGPDCLVPDEQLAACQSRCHWVRPEKVDELPPNG